MAQVYLQSSERPNREDLTCTNEDCLDGDDDINVEEITAEIRQTYGDEASGDLHLEETAYRASGDDVFSALETAIGQLKDDTSAKKSCASCVKPRRVTKVSHIKRGQHISMPGQHSTKYKKETRSLKRAYSHHVIVKKVLKVEGDWIKMVLIHFTRSNGEIAVFEEMKDYDLREKELYIVDYVHPRYNPDRIVERAESILSKKDKFKSYNPLTVNCEHFATWCVVGEGESFQVQSMRTRIANAVSRLSAIGSKIAKGILRIAFVSADEIAASLAKAVPEIVLGATAALYLMYCIIMTVVHINDYRKGQMCWSCVKGKLQDLWFTFGAFGVTSILTFVILHFAIPLMSTGVGIPLMILLILLSVGLQIAVPRLRKALSSPFTVDRIKVTNLNELSHGDVVSFRYYGFKHTSIISDVDVESGKIRVIHYGTSSLCGTRKIVEEYINVDFQKTKIYLLDCKPLHTYFQDIVVSRARSRIGEIKWKLFSNRSDNFSYWAKVKPYDEEEYDSMNEDQSQSISRPLSSTKASLFVKEKDIHHLDDLRIGDVVKSSVIGIIDDTGILSVINYIDGSNGRKFEIEVITYSFFWIVTRKRYMINLNTDKLCVRLYNPAQCQSMEQRVHNAKKIVGEEGEWWTTEGFIEHCIEK